MGKGITTSLSFTGFLDYLDFRTLHSQMKLLGTWFDAFTQCAIISLGDLYSSTAPSDYHRGITTVIVRYFTGASVTSHSTQCNRYACA
jgi:hypothetical protein